MNLKNILQWMPIGMLLLSTPVLAFCGTNKGINFQNLTLEAATKAAKEQNKLVFVDVYTTWCGPCKYLSKEVFPKPVLGDFFNEHFISIKIDAENGEGPGVSQKFDVDAYPSLLFINGEGELVAKKVGAGDEEMILGWGKDARFPEQSLLSILKQQMIENPDSRMLMGSYIRELVANGLDPSETVQDYLERFPELNLKNENDFTAFRYAGFDLQAKETQQFLAEAETLVEGREEVMQEVLSQIIHGELVMAVLEEDESKVTNLVDSVFDAYQIVFGENAFSQDEFQNTLLGIYQDQME